RGPAVLRGGTPRRGTGASGADEQVAVVTTSHGPIMAATGDSHPSPAGEAPVPPTRRCRDTAGAGPCVAGGRRGNRNGSATGSDGRRRGSTGIADGTPVGGTPRADRASGHRSRLRPG